MSRFSSTPKPGASETFSLTVHRHGLADQLRMEHRNNLVGASGAIIRNSANGLLWRVTTKW
jgi:hypothetical protein